MKQIVCIFYIFITIVLFLHIFLVYKYFSTDEVLEYSEIVGTLQGDVRGVVRNSTKGHHFFYFTGIPYAQPPLGKLRFQPPIEPKPWIGIKNATKPPHKCIQMDTIVLNMIEGQEDCLQLNVFTRKLSKRPLERNNLLPVFVFLHGGAFSTGDSSPQQDLGPEILMNKEIVLVTFNCRLGALGLLSTGTKLLPGNLSLKDQVMALRWVQQNIANFGGDPNKVTLFGLSSGAAMVHYHMMSPLSEGLFHRVITMSGTAMNGWAYMTKQAAENIIKHTADSVGCPTEIGEEMINCLKETDAEDLVRALGLYKEHDLTHDAILRPIVEEEGGPMRFLHDTPYELSRQGKVMDIPWLTGYTSNEGLLFVLASTACNGRIKKTVHDVENTFPYLLDYKYTSNNHTDVTQKLIEYHYHGGIPTEETMNEFSELLTYRGFLKGLYESLQPLLEADSTRKSPIYLYRTSKAPKIQSTIRRIFSMNMNFSEFGITHWEDGFFLFKPQMAIFEALSTPEELTISDNMVNAFVQFGSSGNPNVDSSEIWKPLTPTFEYTDINVKLTRRRDFPLETMKFYSSLNIADGGRILDRSIRKNNLR